jgi:hypothetical protein
MLKWQEVTAEQRGHTVQGGIERVGGLVSCEKTLF